MIKPVFVIDTREQDGHHYTFEGYETVRAKLDCGDYSIQGYETEVAVERKTKSDAYGVVGASRDRFLRCLSRLGTLRRAAIVIESSLSDFAIPPPRSSIHPSKAVGSFISWCMQYRLQGPIFAPDQAYGERVTVKFLLAYLRHREEIAAERQER